ncbi:MAG: phosphate ABC transporter ATP-binding protein PstB [Candidatus Brachytrichaceae bacterium NZ_4S206]|jgi:phosphate transport system ATP-binding protein
MTETTAEAPATTTNPYAKPSDIVLRARDLFIYYGNFKAVHSVNMDIERHKITALIGPSGCGKSTLLRAFNRMNDLIPEAHAEGMLEFHGVNLYDKKVDAVDVRRRIGMVFQKPNPFPKSIYENVLYGVRLTRRLRKSEADEIVEKSLRGAALWDEVKDKLQQPGTALSGGQQQRLCIARAIATQPEVILMDEPCSALDPIATIKIEDLMQELKRDYTIVIVTHNMQQAARVSDYTAMMMMRPDRAGEVIEFDQTNTIFTNPRDKRTEDYVTGRFG